jgi:hypothetical protein
MTAALTEPDSTARRRTTPSVDNPAGPLFSDENAKTARCCS